jgi:hypothetical protein
MRWSRYGDTAAHDRLTTDATSSGTRWEFVPGTTEPPPTSTYHNLVAPHSGKVAQIAGTSTAAGAMLVQGSSNGGQNQQFQFVDARISQYAYSGSPNQRFTLRTV